MYLPASLACTCSITSAQLVGFWTTMEYLGSPVKVALSRVSRSMVELPLSTDQDTVVACSQYLQSSLDIPYFDREQRHSTDSSTVHTAGTTTSHQPSSDCESVGTRQCPVSPASSRSCSAAPRSPRCWPPPGCCSPSCHRTWAPPCALQQPAALQPQLILAARINTAVCLLLHYFFAVLKNCHLSVGKSMNFPDRLKRCTGAISADVCTADIFGPIIGSIRPEIWERFYIT